MTCAWSGPRSKVKAALSEPGALQVLELRRLGGRRAVESIGGPPPESFVLVGSSPPSSADRALRSPRNPGAWEWLENQYTAEAKYRAAPRKFTADVDARRKASHDAGRREHGAKAGQRLPTLKPSDKKLLTKLGKTRFRSWRMPPDFVRDVERQIAALAAALAATTTPRAVEAALRKHVRALNELDDAASHPITTPDAEDLVELLVNLAIATGFDEAQAELVVDGAREW